jgi:2'-5' RNA ligase
MRLYAGLTPPQRMLDDLDAVVRSAGGDPSELELVPVHELHVPVASFGNVTLGDAVALGNALTSEAAHWAPLELRFAGGTALEWPGDDSVWAKLDGDIEQLAVMASTVSLVVKRLGFFVDRRTFRTWLGVGHITSSTTSESLQRLVDSLEAYRGPAWTLREICLFRGRPSPLDKERTDLEVYKRIPLDGS